LGQIYGCRGEYKKAEEVFFTLRNAPMPPGRFSDARNPEVRGIVNHLGWALFHQQKYAEAERALRDNESFFAGQPGLGLRLRHSWEGILGASLVAQQRYAEAEPRLLTSYEGLTSIMTHHWSPDIMTQDWSPSPDTPRQGPILFTAEEAAEWLLRLYKEWGKPDKVSEWQRKLQEAKAASHTMSDQELCRS